MKVPTINIPANGYIDTADVAKIIRYRLKVAFPATKFTVRSSRYAGGSSISIGWIDGPSTKTVDAITGAYASHGFDGSIDLQYSKSAWLWPDLTATRAHSTGTQGSGGYAPAYDYPAPHPDAVLVRFGSGYVSTSRMTSAIILRAAQEATGAAGKVVDGWAGGAYFHGDTYDDDKAIWAWLSANDFDLTNAA